MIMYHNRGLVCTACMPKYRWRRCTTPSCDAVIHTECASYVDLWLCPRCIASGIQPAPTPQLHPAEECVSSNPSPMPVNSEDAEQLAIIASHHQFKDSRDREQAHVDARISLAKRELLRMRREAAAATGDQLEDGEAAPAVKGDVGFYSRLYRISYKQLQIAMRFPYDLKPRQRRGRPKNTFKGEGYFAANAMNVLISLNAVN